MSEYRTHAHTVSTCKYHFVWCPKYRRSVLHLVEDRLTTLLHGTAERFDHNIISLEVARDHVHLFVQCDPKWSPAEIAKQFKGYSGRTILKRYPELKREYFATSGLWKDGYYVGTTGDISADVVEQYIEDTEH